MESKYLIIADDFTGSNDTGVQMKKRGIPVKVGLFPTSKVITSSVVLDTESRNLTTNDAYNKVKKMTETVLENNEFDLVYKKVDSTLRGNIIEEIKAIDDVFKPDKIVFAPAYPSIKRTTEKSIHQLNNTPLMSTEFAEDPLSPIITDNITKLLENGYDEDVTHHGLNDLDSIKQRFNKGKLHTFDSVKESDLTTIASALLDNEYKILWVGSAGLANALFRVLYPLKPVLAVVGSISENSLKQVAYAEQNGVPIFEIGNDDIFDKTKIDSIVIKAVNSLEKNGNLIITAAKTRKNYEDTIKYAKSKNISKEDSSWYVQNYLANLTKGVLSKIELSGMFLTGGATAISVMDSINTTSVDIQEEILTGTVHSTLSDGPFKGLNIVTKAGAFGEKEDLLYSLEKIREM